MGHIKEEDDTKLLAETDKLLFDMGYELDEDSLRAKYGEGYRRKAAPPNAEPIDDNPTNFAETRRRADLIDAMDELVDHELADWQPIMDPLTQPLQRFLDDAAAQGLSAAEVLERLPAMLADMDTSALTASLTRTAFAAAAGGEAGFGEADLP